MSGKELEKTKKELINTENNIHLKVGDLLIDRYGSFYKIDTITEEKITILHKWNNEWSSYGDISLEEFYNDKYIKVDGLTEENFSEKYKELLLEAATTDIEFNEDENVSTKALVIKNKEFFQMQKQKMQDIQRKQKILMSVMERKKRQLANVRDKFMSQLRRINKVLGQIELYLGVHEDIVQIQEGEKASQEDPICLRQKIYYMDEEIGFEDDGGLDYNDIEEFDKWLLKDKRYEQFIPEKKSVIVFKPRRNDKDYGYESTSANFFANQPNKQTYLLIRNGDNIYRIFADIFIRERMFPSQAEMEEMFKEGMDENRFTSWELERKEDKVFTYRQNLILLQGLIDRTQIFTPLPMEVNLFQPESYGDFIHFIRDDELLLPNGREYWKDWKKRINDSITEGSRIYFSGFSFYQGYNPYGEYPDIRIQNARVSETPPPGIYTVNRYVEKGKYDYDDSFYCSWLPKEEVWDNDYGYHQRKRKVSFKLHKFDEWVLNYDMISLDDIEYYLTSRVDREYYIDMFPVLKGLKKMRLEELEWEEGFVKQLKGKFNCDEDIIWKAIEWWKNKVKWKRPIMSDDSKALRMITKRIENGQ